MMLNQAFYLNDRITLRSGHRIMTLEEPVVMGILNISPDSFFDGGKYVTVDSALKRAEQIIEEGGRIIDIGAFSSRPGSIMISEKEELDRLLPVLTALEKWFPEQPVSIDTFRAEVARIAATDHGAWMINDISGGNWEPGMFEMIAKLEVPYVMMHSKGMPEVMQKDPHYDTLFPEIIGYFSERVSRLRNMGFSDIIIDPGFGFGKTVEHNFSLLSGLENFRILGLPILVGLSRKSMIQKALKINAENALNGTTVLQTIALMKGAGILRTHDVKEAMQCIQLLKIMIHSGSQEFANFTKNIKHS